MRDPTRGGLATVLTELALAAEVGDRDRRGGAAGPARGQRRLRDPRHRPAVRRQRGQARRVVAPEAADAALAALRAHPLGAEAAIIGEVRAEPPGLVLLETAFGGSRVVDMLAGDPLPRIC